VADLQPPLRLDGDDPIWAIKV